MRLDIIGAGPAYTDRPGATGVAMRLDMETGSHHGVYVVGEEDIDLMVRVAFESINEYFGI